MSISSSLPFIITTLVSVFGYLFLLTKLNRRIKIFYVSAEKSTSNALLMGGVPLIFGITCGVLFLESTPLVNAWLKSSVIIAVGGWVDDRWEIRARVKLFFQAVGSLYFAYHAAQHLEYFWPTFLVISFLSMALLNGTNLLDGLDTMLIKLKTMSFFGFIFCAYHLQSSLLLNLSLLGLVALLSFYPFNRYPSKIHQGEIGSSYIGFFSLLLGVVCIKSGGSLQGISTLSYALIILSLPIIELTVSFSRRIFAKKSPFRGDRLHLHHILKNKYHWSPLKTTSILAVALGLSFVVSFCLANIVNPLTAFFFHYALTFSLYIGFCYKSWLHANSALTSSSLFLSIDQNKIDYIDIKLVDGLTYLNQLNSLNKKKIAS